MHKQIGHRGKPSMIQKIRERIAARLRIAARGVKEAVIIEVDGGEPATEYNANAYLQPLEEIVNQLGLEEADSLFRRNAQVYRERRRLNAIAIRLPELQETAERLEEEWRAADVAEADRHRQELQRLEQMKNAARLAVDAASEAVGAKADLIAGADDKPEAAQIFAQATSLVRQIEKLREKLDPSDRENGDTRNVIYWGTIADRPALLERQSKQMLDARNMSLSPQRRSELQKQYEAARDETKRCREELARLEAEHAALMKQATWTEEEAMRPENFRLRMPQLSADEQRRRHAKRFGLGADDAGYAITRG